MLYHSSLLTQTTGIISSFLVTSPGLRTRTGGIEKTGVKKLSMPELRVLRQGEDARPVVWRFLKPDPCITVILACLSLSWHHKPSVMDVFIGDTVGAAGSQHTIAQHQAGSHPSTAYRHRW